MNKIDVSDRLSNIWINSRTQAHKSQEYMAKALGTSKKTIQNWESGLSSPNVLTALEWFDVLGIQPIPYIMSLACPSYKNEAPKTSAEEIEKALINIIHILSPHTKEELLYILSGAHGSSPVAVLEMITADLHAPLSFRLNIANNILTNYQITQKFEMDVSSDDVKPNIDCLSLAIALGTEAVFSKNKGYMLRE